MYICTVTTFCNCHDFIYLYGYIYAFFVRTATTFCIFTYAVESTHHCRHFKTDNLCRFPHMNETDIWSSLDTPLEHMRASLERLSRDPLLHDSLEVYGGHDYGGEKTTMGAERARGVLNPRIMQRML
jgi:hypothetical protein